MRTRHALRRPPPTRPPQTSAADGFPQFEGNLYHPSISNYGIGWVKLAKGVPQGVGVGAGPPMPRL